MRDYRPSTPDLQPTKTQEFRTPKRKCEWLPIVGSLRQVIPPSHQLSLTRIEHHLDELEAEILTLRRQLRVRNKAAREEEDSLIYKRIRKLKDNIVISFSDVLRYRGAADDEIKLLVDQQPSVFTVIEDADTRRRLRRRVKRIDQNIQQQE